MSTDHVTLAHPELRNLRRALAATIATNLNVSRIERAAVKEACAAYLLLFTPNEQRQIIEHAERYQVSLPDDHLLKAQPKIVTFQDAVKRFGTLTIAKVLGD